MNTMQRTIIQTDKGEHMHNYLGIAIVYNGEFFTFTLGKATITVKTLENAIRAINTYNGIA